MRQFTKCNQSSGSGKLLKGEKKIDLDSIKATEPILNLNSISGCSPRPATETLAIHSTGSTLYLVTAFALRTATFGSNFLQ